MVTTEAFIQKDNPPYVRFARVAVEDIPGSLQAGRSVMKDVDFAYITPHGSKDILIKKVPEWKTGLQAQLKRGQIAQSWFEHFMKSHDAWENGQELPVIGDPIKGWAVISPAQQENLVRLNIRTVEDLASISGEGLQRIGMGAVALKHKATAWLQQAKDKGPLTIEIAALKEKNALLENNVRSLTETSTLMQAQLQALESLRSPHVNTPAQNTDHITADDIFDKPEESSPSRKSGGKKVS